MKKLYPVLTGVLAAAIALLVLNLRESDHYEFGTPMRPLKGATLAASDADLDRIFPELKFTHVCAGCGECVHPFEIVENRRMLSIHDHDGWYKLFWAADENYSYDDPIHMVADWGQNRTAETPRGSWRIQLRAAAATHRTAPAHDCGRIPKNITLSYGLVWSEDSIETTYHSGDGPLKVVEQVSWVILNPGRPINLGWRLSTSPGVDVAACPCVKP